VSNAVSDQLFLRRNSILNFAGAVIPLIAGALSVPFLLRTLGVDRFGVLTLLWALIGYFSLFDLGMGRAVTQQVAALLGDGRVREIRRVVTTSTVITLLTGLCGGLLMVLAAHPVATMHLGLQPEYVAETRDCLRIAAIGVPLATLAANWRGVLEGYGRFGQVNLVKISLGVGIFLIPVIGVLLFGASLRVVTIGLVIARLFSTIGFGVLSLALPHRLEASVPHRATEVWELVRFSLWMGVSSLVSPLLIYVDRFAIAKMLGASQVAYYTVPFEVIVRILVIPGAIGAALLPQLSQAFSRNPIEALGTLRAAWRLNAGLMLLCTMVAAGAAFPVMTHFISREFADRAIIVSLILCVGVFLNGIANIPFSALHALGVARKTGMLHLIELVLYLPLLYILIRNAGIVGAALAWALRTAFDLTAQSLILHRTIRAYRV
jgi:O-antigen/teichoic acid export membrane protein